MFSLFSHRSFYAFISSPGYHFAPYFQEVDFCFNGGGHAATGVKQLVHGTFMTRAFWRIRSSDSEELLLATDAMFKGELEVVIDELHVVVQQREDSEITADDIRDVKEAQVRGDAAVQAARLRCIRNVRLTKQMGGKFGVTFGAATDVRGRVLIEKIFIGYPAVESGEIEAGDQVLAVNKQLVATPEAAHKLCIAALEFVELRTVSRSLRWLDAGG